VIEDWASQTLDSWGYVGLALLILLENVFPPIPSELILPLAGYTVSRGDLSFVPALLAATAGSVAGAALLYAVARFGGQPLVLRAAPLLRVSEAQVLRLEERFRRHGDAYVLFGRLLPGVRSVVSIPAGLSAMPVTRFFVFTTIGAAAWNALLIGAGVLLGSQYDRVSSVVGPIAWLLIGGLALALVVWVVRTALGRRARRTPG
jgi:membrane protein DedA with SNARE-associated domain